MLDPLVWVVKNIFRSHSPCQVAFASFCVSLSDTRAIGMDILFQQIPSCESQLSKIHPVSSGDFILPIHRTVTQKSLAQSGIWWPSNVQDTSFQERLLCPIRCPSSPISPPCPFHPACMLYTLSLHCGAISIHTQRLSSPCAAFRDAVPTSLVALELWI